MLLRYHCRWRWIKKGAQWRWGRGRRVRSNEKNRTSIIIVTSYSSSTSSSSLASSSSNPSSSKLMSQQRKDPSGTSSARRRKGDSGDRRNVEPSCLIFNVTDCQDLDTAENLIKSSHDPTIFCPMISSNSDGKLSQLTFLLSMKKMWRQKDTRLKLYKTINSDELGENMRRYDKVKTALQYIVIFSN